MEETSGGETMLQGRLFEEASQDRRGGEGRRQVERRDGSGERQTGKALGLTSSISVSSSVSI